MAKGKANGKNKAFYERQKAVTTLNKARRAKKRANKLAGWIKAGKKKNGKLVLGLEERKVRAAKRKVTRQENRRALAKERREQDQQWQGSGRAHNNRGKKRAWSPRAPVTPDSD